MVSLEVLKSRSSLYSFLLDEAEDFSVFFLDEELLKMLMVE
jgi:hypothetical protein